MSTPVGLSPVVPEILEVLGSEPWKALNKVLASDLTGLADGEMRPGLLLHPKGQFRGMMAVARLGEELWLLVPQGFGETLSQSLNHYLQFSKVQVRTKDEPRFLWLGETSPGLPLPAAQPWRCLRQGPARYFFATLLGLPGVLVVGQEAPGLPSVSLAQLELARIAAGFPAWGKELTPDVLPGEAGLGEPWVSLRKGCYPGQETMARLATYGHVNRLLVRLRGSQTACLAGKPLPVELEAEGPGSKKGRLTSWAVDEQGEAWALGLVHRTVAREGVCLVACGAPFQVQAVLA
ncbi:MAG: hypothetical protein NZ869_03545 [Thermoanaerobaculum sp.]|nr:hypothetical protein [Thermoanaerobaculum sp.]MCX7895257.1 hypothetical protein [Thermoanaerobaculum sp.]MDW7968300.1 hypothetical protein [Thermoanaerobaculum sp.]